PAGDLVAVAKLSDTTTGDTLAPKNTPVLASGPPPAPPVLSIAIRPRSKGDEDKLMTALHRLQEEDPSIEVTRSDETHQTVLAGMGETHLSIACERLHRKFGVDVETEEVKVPYRETISKSADAEGKYKKQTGGHGQFGVANLRVDPLERGEGFAFEDKVVGGARAARAHLRARGHRPRRLPGRRHQRPQLAPGPDPGHRLGQRRGSDRDRPGAHLRGPALCHRPAFVDGWPGALHPEPPPLRR